MAKEIHLQQTVFPILLGTRDVKDKTSLIVEDVIGTCFHIGGCYFMTAGHVVESIKNNASKSAAISILEGENLRPINIIETEVLDCDIGILKCANTFPKDLANAHTIEWGNGTINLKDTLYASGYPFGLYRRGNDATLVQRTFQGHVICEIHKFKPPALNGHYFRVLELSFQVPRGLSGAPLFSQSKSEFLIHGVMIGNSESAMKVYSTKETIKETDTTTTYYDRDEVMCLGVAVHPASILPLKSTLLNGTVQEHIQNHNLL